MRHGRDQGRWLLGEPHLIAAAIGAMLGMFGYAIPSTGQPEDDDRIVDSLTGLLFTADRTTPGIGAVVTPPGSAASLLTR
ncbi:hypothetical protein ACTOB_003586 [Actinoplanes oblitus]|uniref:Uncharacterized protein n=1 Tax=Actinoplanes oblitus TaxID=3040509 RepID=A0ABY8WSD7_9ACTN|nr:hypothetical protein [Actinoplanes oblitus]WIM99916.1 hypothetical protein ACTOB_003586 [Actinoplanes oblitus]